MYFNIYLEYYNIFNMIILFSLIIKINILYWLKFVLILNYIEYMEML